MRLCSVEGCGDVHRAKGFCSIHYGRWRAHGEPHAFKKSPQWQARNWVLEVALRFDGEECLTFPFPLADTGYGEFKWKAKRYLAHRYVCAAINGEPPADKPYAAHECGNRACVNPRHLSWKTGKENSDDRLRHGTHLFGEINPSAKLTWDEVGQIRSMEDRPNSELASSFGVCAGTIDHIKKGTTWSEETRARAAIAEMEGKA